MIQTTDINEAAYLYMLGIAPEGIKRISQVQAIFFFKKTKEIKEILIHYRTGMAEGSLSHFMFTRGVLKSMAAASTIEKIDENQPAVGDYYFFIVNKTIIGAHFGNKEITHYERWKTGNYYKTKQEAQKALGL
jgi:hypothetical protein